MFRFKNEHNRSRVLGRHVIGGDSNDCLRIREGRMTRRLAHTVEDRAKRSVTTLAVALFALSISTLLAGCATRSETGVLALAAASAPGATEHRIFVATTRERDPQPGTLFNGERSEALNYAAITVSIPPNHVAGAIEWPSASPGDPASTFVTRRVDNLDSDREFVRNLDAQLARRARGARDVFLFIHGYNTTFADGLYRLA
jgi:hypothetical protein